MAKGRAVAGDSKPVGQHILRQRVRLAAREELMLMIMNNQKLTLREEMEPQATVKHPTL